MNNYDTIRDVDTVLRNGESFVTEKLNCCLKALIISTNKPVQIKIFFAEVEEIVIFEDDNFSGSHYIPIKITSISKDGEGFNYSPEQWILNNKVGIEVKGPEGSEVNITLRVA